MNKTELSNLTVKEINVALGGKYSESQLKNVKKEVLINEWVEEHNPPKPAKKTKAWEQLMREFMLESGGLQPEDIVTKMIETAPKESFSLKCFKQDGSFNRKTLLAVINNWRIGRNLGKKYVFITEGDKVRLELK